MDVAVKLAVALVLFVVAASARLPSPQARQGNVRVSGHAVADDRSEFAALGASLFWAAWAYKHDKARLDSHLKLLAEHRFDYIRVLGVVGRQPYWAGREVDWRWPDYRDVIAGLTDYAYDRYGLRTEWTIFADADQMIPARDDRFKLLDAFLEMSRRREHKIMHFEIANESWQNGFGGAEGIAQIRELAAYLAERTAIPVAISDSEGNSCDDHLLLYKDMKVDILTEHFARDVRGTRRRWEPVIAPWQVRQCPGLPQVISSNEPIGPRSSLASEDDPMRLIAAAISSYMAGVGLYVFHTDAGIWGREAITDMPNAATILKAFAAMKGYVPPDIANWRHYRHDAPEHPFILYAGDQRGAPITDTSSDGALELFASIKGNQFFVLAIGIVNGLTIETKRAAKFDVIHPLTGEKLAEHVLAPAERIKLRPLPALVLSGTFS
jgi:hypothetical protein